jgi:predicted nucleotidyltransferase component of viral defense system
MEAPTTEELLDDAEARTGLARGQLLMMVAKSATVRHLACHPDYRDLFVLKGGTLLSNVYRSPRQSVKDADYTYLDPQSLLAPELEQALSTMASTASTFRLKKRSRSTATCSLGTRHSRWTA